MPRADTSAEALAKLKPAFKADGIVTAGTASPLSDGASAHRRRQRRGASSATASRRAPGSWRSASAGVPPHIMGLGPVPSTEKVLARSGWEVSDLDAVEINEAFATQVIASIRRLGLDPETVNAYGGAIAVGHPLGASGVRLVLGLLRRLEDGDLQARPGDPVHRRRPGHGAHRRAGLRGHADPFPRHRTQVVCSCCAHMCA